MGSDVSQWMRDKKKFQLSFHDIAVQLDLISKVHGTELAENYFNNIPEKSKVVEAYEVLLNCYARDESVEKAEAIMQKMRELGQTTFCFNVHMEEGTIKEENKGKHPSTQEGAVLFKQAALIIEGSTSEEQSPFGNIDRAALYRTGESQVHSTSSPISVSQCDLEGVIAEDSEPPAFASNNESTSEPIAIASLPRADDMASPIHQTEIEESEIPCPPNSTIEDFSTSSQISISHPMETRSRTGIFSNKLCTSFKQRTSKLLYSSLIERIDDDDDQPTLSAQALEALREFLGEQNRAPVADDEAAPPVTKSRHRRKLRFWRRTGG
ncbi:hypothetical protein C3L33_02395, partial [Rhododendron williamsianum]